MIGIICGVVSCILIVIVILAILIIVKQSKANKTQYESFLVDISDYIEKESENNVKENVETINTNPKDYFEIIL